MKKRIRKDKWCVYGEYGDYFTNLKDAKACAKEVSLIEEDESIGVWLIESELSYIEYENGKMIRDGWTRKKKG